MAWERWPQGPGALGLSASSQTRISLLWLRLRLLLAEPFVNCCTSVLLSGPGLVGGAPVLGIEEMWVTMYQVAGSLLALHQLLEAQATHVGLVSAE